METLQEQRIFELEAMLLEAMQRGLDNGNLELIFCLPAEYYIWRGGHHFVGSGGSNWQTVADIVSSLQRNESRDTPLEGSVREILSSKKSEFISVLAKYGIHEKEIVSDGYNISFPYNQLNVNMQVLGQRGVGVIYKTPSGSAEQQMYLDMGFPSVNGIHNTDIQRVLNYRKFIILGSLEYIFNQCINIALLPLESAIEEESVRTFDGFGQSGFITRIEPEAILKYTSLPTQKVFDQYLDRREIRRLLPEAIEAMERVRVHLQKNI